MSSAIPLSFTPASTAAQFWRNLLLAGTYLSGIWLVAVGLTEALDWPLFTEQAFTNWDTEHYLHIRSRGYKVLTTAFFPLFPLVWRWLDVSARAMAAINLGLFALAFAVLSTTFQFSKRQQLLALSVPLLCFMGLAYSEALFFGAGVLVLLGWQRQNLLLLGLGLYLCGVTRSSAFVLVPAGLLTAYLTRTSWAAVAWQAAVSVGASGAGLATSVYVHYLDTGRWFVFFEAQRQGWNNHIGWPRWPLSSWGSSFSTYCEAVVFLFALAVAGYLLRQLWQHRPAQPASSWAPVLFSMAYVAGVAAVTILTKGGMLISLGRYVLATPYGLLVLVWGLRSFTFASRHLLVALLVSEVCWLACFASYGHIRTALAYTVVSAYVVLVLACAHSLEKVQRGASITLIAINSMLLIWLLFRFLAHEWVG